MRTLEMAGFNILGLKLNADTEKCEESTECKPRLKKQDKPKEKWMQSITFSEMIHRTAQEQIESVCKRGKSIIKHTKAGGVTRVKRQTNIHAA